MARIAAIVLAAGVSRRFGADKLMQPVHGKPLLAQALNPWLSVFERVTVVVRPQGEALQQKVTQALGNTAQNLNWVVCPNADSGMAASLARGVAANPDADGWLIGLGDMPDLPQEAVSKLRDALRGGAALAAPFFDGRRGHPVGFARQYRDELLALLGDAGAKGLLMRDAALLQRVSVHHAGILTDIDEPSDLQHYLEHIP